MDPCNTIPTGPKYQLTTELDKLQNNLEVEQHVPQSQETEMISNSPSNQLLCHEIPPTDKSPINLVQCPPQLHSSLVQYPSPSNLVQRPAQLTSNLIQCPPQPPQSPSNIVQYPPQPPSNLIQCPPQSPSNLVQSPPQPPSNLVQYPPQPPSNLIQCPPQSPSNLVQYPPQPLSNLVQYPPQPPSNLVQSPPQPPSNLVQSPPQLPSNFVECPSQFINNSITINHDQYRYQAQPPQAGDLFNNFPQSFHLPTQNSNPSQQTNYNSPNCIEYLDLPTWNPISARTNHPRDDSSSVSPTVFPGSSLALPCVSCGHCSVGSVPPTQPQWSSNQSYAECFPQWNPNAPRHSMPAPSIPHVVVNQPNGSQTIGQQTKVSKECTGVETRRPSININITVGGKCKHDKGTTEKFSKCGICCCLLIPVIGCIFCMKRKDLVCIKCDKVVGKATSKKKSENKSENNQEKSGERKGDVKTKKGKEHDNSKKELGKAKLVKGAEKKKSDANGEKSGKRKVVQTSTKAKEHGKSKKKIDKKKLLKDN